MLNLIELRAGCRCRSWLLLGDFFARVYFAFNSVFIGEIDTVSVSVFFATKLVFPRVAGFITKVLHHVRIKFRNYTRHDLNVACNGLMVERQTITVKLKCTNCLLVVLEMN